MNIFLDHRFRGFLGGLTLSAAGWPSLGAREFHSVQVNVDVLGRDIVGDAANEPSIAVHPIEPNRMAIGWRQFDTIASDFRQAGVAYTTDGGKTWTARTLEPGQWQSDPVLDFDADGNFYYLGLRSLSFDTVALFKSTNGGKSWSAPTIADGGDKSWMAVDKTRSVGRGNIYQHWNVELGCCSGAGFSRSTNGGNSFEPVVIGPQPAMKWGTIEVASNGTVYVAGAALNRLQGHRFSKSTNAKDPSQTPTFSTSQPIDLGGVTSAGGVNPAGLLGQVNIATSPDASKIYVLASVDPPGLDPLDVMFIKSCDDGETWSSPVRVNNDALGNGAYQWFGTMSVAPNGRIDVIWNDTRKLPLGFSTLAYTYSCDEGDSWQGNIRISNRFPHFAGYPSQSKLGDYYDMVSSITGVNVAYAATFNGGQDVYFLRIDATAGNCGQPRPGDTNGDGKVNGSDIEPFVLALVDPDAYGRKTGFDPMAVGDIDGDGELSGLDIEPFIALQVGSNADPVLASPQRLLAGSSRDERFRIERVTRKGGLLELEWSSGIGDAYLIEWSASGEAGSWEVVDPEPIRAEGTTTIVRIHDIPVSQGGALLRVRALRQAIQGDDPSGSVGQ